LILKNFLTFQKIRKKVNQINGITKRTARVNCQFIVKSKILDQIIKNIEEIIEEIAWETNILIQSTSAVRFVKSLA
jgi:hypothetical protein